MYKLFLLFSFLFSINNYAQKLIKITNDDEQINYYYFENSNNLKERKLIIFLHGSVNHEYYKNNRIPNFEFLIEGNYNFIKYFNNLGYDIILPIATKENNWLNPSSYSSIKKITMNYMQTQNKSVEKYICGFSDGGNGAYNYFYNNTNDFQGLIVFNGYLQYNNQNKKVDYRVGIGKKVIFISQKNDNIVPYELLYMEYTKQKLINETTYFYLTKGKHEFINYKEDDFLLLDSMLNLKNKYPLNQNLYDIQELDKKVYLFPSYEAYIINDELVEFYKIRKRKLRKYGLINNFIITRISFKNRINKNIYNSEKFKSILTKEFFNETRIINFEIKIANSNLNIPIKNFLYKINQI